MGRGVFFQNACGSFGVCFSSFDLCCSICLATLKKHPVRH